MRVKPCGVRKASTMARHHILEVVRLIPDCRLDDLASNCQDFSLQAVLSEVSRLSREGQLQLTIVSTGSFTMQLLNEKCRSRLVTDSLNEGEHREKGQH